MKKRSENKYLISYIIMVLCISNVLWYMGYSMPIEDDAVLFIMASSFFPMILALIFAKLSKEGWENLGICFNLKKSWKIYLMSIIGTCLLTYMADPFMLMIFPENVTTTFTVKKISSVLLALLLGTGCLIECLGEELGWIGYLFPKLERYVGTVLAIIMLGIIRGCYHLGIIIFMEYPIQGFMEITISNILLQAFMVYMYKKGGSLFPCSISHGISNLIPIFLVYENEWYYNNYLAMAICMLPALLFGIVSMLKIRKLDSFVRFTVRSRKA